MNFKEFLLQENLEQEILNVLGGHAKRELTADEIASEVNTPTKLVTDILKDLMKNNFVYRGIASDGSWRVTWVLNPSKR